MYKISLVNMPFASLSLPSIALTQLKAVVDQRCEGRVEVRVLYLNHELARFLGPELYKVLGTMQASSAGVGDWWFRDIAFPGQPDNSEEYFKRHFPQNDPAMEARKRLILSKRPMLERFLKRLITKYRLDQDDLVGFTSMFSQSVASIAMAQLLKKRNDAVVTVLGGANCEGSMGRELVRHIPSVDFVFSGPGLVSFPTFVERQLAGDGAACHEIRGVFSRRNHDSEHLEGAGAIGEELPIEEPVPLDYDVFLKDLEDQFPNGEVEPSLLFETSRGCWWGERSHCTFCGLNGRTSRWICTKTYTI